MQVNKISANNNPAFGAHFKNNLLFKETFRVFQSTLKDDGILDRFVKECPDHEIEIINKIQFNDLTRRYFIFNNTTGGSMIVDAQPKENAFEKIMSETCSALKCRSNRFWGKDGLEVEPGALMQDVYQRLVGLKK